MESFLRCFFGVFSSAPPRSGPPLRGALKRAGSAAARRAAGAVRRARMGAAALRAAGHLKGLTKGSKSTF
ncbi:hypothetical protein RRG08_059274 [Elysia crispata]|uniref:Uncharacterized protein n=1 Tax=Elysia crispata TaxID=231223 RepID=A0AAE0YA55_9GAST|nr:hypothetical protein RRG08_059274 [Elysia crispata]